MKHHCHNKFTALSGDILWRPLAAILGLTLMLTFTACKSDDPKPDPEPEEYSTSILLYAVASNNLSYDFADDLQELLEGASALDLSKSDIWIYSLTPKEDPTLRHVVKDRQGDIGVTTVKEYARDKFSTDPARISEVISDYIGLSPARSRGLVMWSHATGWQPNFPDHVVPEPKGSAMPGGKVDLPMNYSYGADQYQGKTDYCDILELDEAIPAGTFDFLWFDCCYMSAIEVLYQLRDKAARIVAYPTEVAAEGMPYDLTIPYMAAEHHDLEGAARAMAGYYLDKNAVVTIALIDTSALGAVAAAAATATGDGNTRPPMSHLQRYSRSPNGPFYDFVQYTRTWGDAKSDGWNSAEFEKAIAAAVIYKEASDYGFDRRPILPENYSGISCHYFWDDSDGYDSDAEKARYYKRLDWYQDVYQGYHE